VVHYLNGHDNANDNEDDEEYEEADPALSACRSCRGHGLFRIAKTARGHESEVAQAVENPSSPSFDILLNFRSLGLDDIDSLVLLLDQDTHLAVKVKSGKQLHNGHGDGRR
jgi:hypothetical protein